MAAASRPTSSRSRHAPADVLPTTKWANRVLRPLNSIVLRLEKHWKSTAPPDNRQHSNSNNSKHAQHNNTSPRKRSSLPSTATTTARGRFNDGGAQLSDLDTSRDDSDDPSWVPGQDTRRKVRHKYSSGNPRVRGRNSAGAGVGMVSIFKSPEARRRSLPGEITIATPFIMGRTKSIFDGEILPSGSGHNSESQPHGENRYASNQKGTTQWRQNEVTTSKVNGFQDYDDLGYCAIVDGICPVFETFLRATCDKKPATTLGARSLVSMALAKVSDYIGAEQKAHDESEDKDEEVDMADVIFTELEDFYSLPGGGWKPLKELVRAHGVRLICESVRKKWISPQTTQRLILSSLRLASHDVAKSLFSVLLSIAPDIDRPKGLHSCLFSNDSLGERSILSPYLDLVTAGTPGHLSFFFREVKSLILRGVVPVEWMATESMKPFMNRAVQSISCGDENFYSAVEYLEAVVLVAAGIDTSIYESTVSSLRTKKRTKLRSGGRVRSGTPPTSNGRSDSRHSSTPTHLRTALNNTISSLITLLSGIHISRFGVGTEDSLSVSSPARDMITRLSTAVQQDVELRCSDSKSEFTALPSTRCSYILLGDYLCLGEIFGNGNDSAETVPTNSLLSNFDCFIQTMSHRKDLLGELSDLVEQIVTCCGRALGTDGFSELKGFGEILTSTSTGPYPSLKLLLGKVAAESAMSFAESTQHPDHHEWATYIQTKAAEYNHKQDNFDGEECPTPSLNLSKTGFRWEDSIGEWVAKTPVTIPSKNCYEDADSEMVIPDSEDPYSSPIRCVSDKKASFSAPEESSSVAPSTPRSCQKRKRIESSPFIFDTVPNKRRATMECVEITAQQTATPPRPSRLRQKHRWKPYTDYIDDNEIYPLPLSPSRTSERSSTSSPRRRTDRETRSVTRERILQERKQNDNRSRATARPQKRKSITFEVVVVNKKRKTGHDSASDCMTDDDDDDDDGSDGEWSGPSSPRAGSRSRNRSRLQCQRSPSRESCVTPDNKGPGRELRSRKSDVVGNRRRMAPCSSFEVADSQDGSDDELSFL